MDKPSEEFVEAVITMMDIGNRTDNSTGFISSDYAPVIINALADDVAQDVWETADRENFNDDDVRMAVGRVLMKRLGIEQ